MNPSHSLGPRGHLAAAVLATAMLLAGAGTPEAAAGRLTDGPVQHLRGIYRQRAIEIATVGPRTVRLTRMTRFRRCGGLRGIAEDFNEHLVDVAGREIEGLGFVAGYVNAIDGCVPAAAPARGMGD